MIMVMKNKIANKINMRNKKKNIIRQGINNQNRLVVKNVVRAGLYH